MNDDILARINQMLEAPRTAIYMPLPDEVPSGIELKDDGSVVFFDGHGSTIHMVGGQVEIGAYELESTEFDSSGIIIAVDDDDDDDSDDDAHTPFIVDVPVG